MRLVIKWKNRRMNKNVRKYATIIHTLIRSWFILLWNTVGSIKNISEVYPTAAGHSAHYTDIRTTHTNRKQIFHSTIKSTIISNSWIILYVVVFFVDKLCKCTFEHRTAAAIRIFPEGCFSNNHKTFAHIFIFPIKILLP